MNKQQTNYYKMFLNVQEFMNENSSIWSPIPRIANYKNDIDEIILHLIEKSEQSLEGLSVTDKKGKLKKQIAMKLSVLSGVLTAFAYEQDDMDLVAKVKLNKSDIIKMKETEVDAYSKSITSIASKHIAELTEYGLSEALIIELNNVVDEFNGLIGKPRNLLNKKYVSLGQVEQLIDEGNKLLKNKLDKLMLMFRDTQPDFYNGYQRARVIVDM